MSNVGVSVSSEVAPTKQVRKRDGTTLQPFDPDKIKKAVRAAWEEAKAPLDERSLGKVVRSVTDALNDDVVDVETIQDAVETSLMRHKQFPVAKAFILYRQQRAEARQERIGKSPDPLAISDYIHASKYARYLPELQRREVYEETVARTEQMHIRRFPELEEDIRWTFDRVREKRVLPSMRSLQFGGAAIEACHNRIYNCSYSYIDRPEAFSQALYLLLCGCGVGYSVQFEHVERLPAIPYIDPKKIRHHVIADTIEGWADALKALIQCFLDGVYVEFAYHLIRGAGVPLKTSGGRAPGHVGLKTSLERIRGVLSGAQGRKLRSVECHRILCHAADAVLSGGIRRAAMLALFSLEDSEMMQIKTGNWYASEPWLANANNSVAIKRDEVKKKAFKRIFQMTKEWGEPGFLFVDDYGYGTNPSMPAGTLIGTRGGIFPIEELEGQKFEVKSLDGTFATAECFLSGENEDVLEIGFGAHMTTHSTPQHRWPVLVNGSIVKKYASELAAGDLIPLNRNEVTGMCGDPTLTEEDGFMVGYLFGDGSISQRPNGKYTLFVSVGAEKMDVAKKLLALINARKQEPSNITARDRKGVTEYSIQTTEQGFIEMLLSRYGMHVNKANGLPSKIWTSNDGFVRGFVDGLLSTDGCVSTKNKRVSLSTSQAKVAVEWAKLLSFYGVICRLKHASVPGVFPNGKDYGKLYEAWTVHFGMPMVPAFTKIFRLSHAAKQERLETLVSRPRAGKSKRQNEIKAQYLKIKWVRPVEKARVWDITVHHDQHVFPSQWVYSGNCGEVSFFPRLTITSDLAADLARRGIQANVGDTHTGYAFCNLSEINGAKLKSKEDFLIAAKAATILGTLQASYTDMPYLGWVSEEIAKRDALLGVGMTGMFDSPEIACNPEMQREVVAKMVAWNREYAARVGVRSAARISCVKPSGTSSLELGGVASGHHPHHARRYIRRVTADELEHVFQAFRAVNPHMCVRKPDGKWVIEFPVEAPPNAILKEDVRAIPFLEMVKSTQQNWVIPGTARDDGNPGITNNVSNTVVVREEEWEDVAEYLWNNRAFFTGVSMLPATGDKAYAFAPFEAITTPADESRWNAILASYQPVDYSAMVEPDDTTNLKGEVACAGGACAIV